MKTASELRNDDDIKEFYKNAVRKGAINLFKRGLSVEHVVRFTGLSRKEVEQLQKSLPNSND